MGYDTRFSGKFDIEPKLTSNHEAYLHKFANTRRMKRDANLARQLEDANRANVDLPIGKDGEYFVGGIGYMGQGDDKSIVNCNNPPADQPGLWCRWIPNEDGTAIVFDDETEKFYGYIEWIEYLIEHFLKPWGYTLNGKVRWRGEHIDDYGTIVIEDNNVSVRSVDW